MRIVKIAGELTTKESIELKSAILRTFVEKKNERELSPLHHDMPYFQSSYQLHSTLQLLIIGQLLF